MLFECLSVERTSPQGGHGAGTPSCGFGRLVGSTPVRPCLSMERPKPCFSLRGCSPLGQDRPGGGGATILLDLWGAQVISGLPSSLLPRGRGRPDQGPRPGEPAPPLPEPANARGV